MTMEFEHAKLIRITKRIRYAIGYFELGMAEQAIQWLDSLDQLGELGPFKLAAEMIRAEAFKAQKQYDAAALSLEAAAKMLPAPYDQSVWLALSLCYQQAGDTQRAINSLGCARGASPSQAS
jgi:tetratricopeptide (TPR) repeat protein